jgi:uncharacterized membrane protein
VTFWQATADMAAAYWAPAGHGHWYGAELVDAWASVAPPDAVATATPPDRRAAARAAVRSDGGRAQVTAGWAGMVSPGG